MRTTLIILLFFSVLHTCAQSYVSKKYFAKKLDYANEQFSYENYHLALSAYQELFNADTANTEVAFKLGVCLFKMRRQTLESMPYFVKAKSEWPAASFYLGQLYHRLMYFDKALEAYLEFKNTGDNQYASASEVELLMQKSFAAKEMLKSDTKVVVDNLGELINTGYSEYVPLIFPDESLLFFTSRRKGSTGELLDPYNEYFEDVYFSKKENGKWTKPENIGSPINTSTHDACVTLSKDAHKLYIYRTNESMTGGDVYVSENNDGVWSEPEKLQANVNTLSGSESSISISPDENTIYFSSNMEGGYGGKDLYRVTKMPDQTWSRPLNLGPAVNTPQNEDAPFIHPDGVTLYFSSEGHKNVGGYDIFVTTKNEDGQWSFPENLGFPINSVRDDIYFMVTFDGKTAYFSSNRDNGFGNSDIYKANMSEVKNNNIIFKGTVITNEPEFSTVKATITIIDYDTKELQGIYRTNKNGKYILVLLPRKKYKLIVEAEGFYTWVDEIDLKEKIHIEDLMKTINLKRTNE